MIILINIEECFIGLGKSVDGEKGNKSRLEMDRNNAKGCEELHRLDRTEETAFVMSDAPLYCWELNFSLLRERRTT